MKRHTLLSYAILMALASAVHADIFIDEQFDYGNGDLTTVSGGTWAAHIAGGTFPIQVVDGSAIVKFEFPRTTTDTPAARVWHLAILGITAFSFLSKTCETQTSQPSQQIISRTLKMPALLICVLASI